ncbi:hypothetical protein [Pseudomonas phage LUZ7]|uniref:Uncharacterized protein n=1 Tax=Pseudomonas phage LUZ7 TaxID=655097 RepID=C8ZKI6_9CAUD|nr:hypothetical protein PP-LUZ7_gp087 [Pseudomonas phage LUZ7]CAZ66228.1 hypothetical protein [Pseudomonas phage LUZ7]
MALVNLTIPDEDLIEFVHFRCRRNKYYKEGLRLPPLYSCRSVERYQKTYGGLGGDATTALYIAARQRGYVKY